MSLENKKTSKQKKSDPIYAYKLMRKRVDGSIGSLYIGRAKKLPINEWIKSECIPTKKFKVRAGWHTLSKPVAPHLKKDIDQRKWFYVQISNYKKIERPKSQGGIWYISDWIKIIKQIN
jgi:hypothetical protein